MTRSTRLTAATALLASIALLAGCTGGTPPTPSASVAATPAAPPAAVPAPTPPPVPTPAPSFAAATAQTIRDAVAALDDLRSYRFVEEVDQDGYPSARRDGIVVNDKLPRVRTDGIADGTLYMSTIQIGSRTWISLAGSNFVEQEDWGGGPDAEWQSPLAGSVDADQLGLGRIEDFGVESLAGGPARHLRGTATEEPFDDDLGFSTGPGYAGIADIWIDVAGGHLVAATFEGTKRDIDFGSFGPDDEAPTPEPTRSPYSLDVRVDGVDDAANVVDEPPAVEPAPLPSGDPAAAALIEGIGDALSALDSWHLETSQSLAGMDPIATLTVVNRPVRAARSEVATGLPGFPGISVMVIGARTWSRSGDEPWTEAKGDDGPGCGTTGSSKDMTPCTFENMTQSVGAIPHEVSTFAIVGNDEPVDGTSCTHVRSEAGMLLRGMTIPGSHDMWIANDGGYLVRDVFTGTGFNTTASVTRINDPANELKPPKG